MREGYERLASNGVTYSLRRSRELSSLIYCCSLLDTDVHKLYLTNLALSYLGNVLTVHISSLWVSFLWAILCHFIHYKSSSFLSKKGVNSANFETSLWVIFLWAMSLLTTWTIHTITYRAFRYNNIIKAKNVGTFGAIFIHFQDANNRARMVRKMCLLQVIVACLTVWLTG